MPVKIFCCYAHEDEPLLKKLKAHLRPLQRQGLIDVWHDRDITAGTECEQEMSKHLNEAQIILLLISPDFMVRCPLCLDQFHVGDCDIVSRIDGRLLRRGPTPNEWKTPRRENVESLMSPKYLRQRACRKCPYCDYLLPFNIERAKNISLA